MAIPSALSGYALRPLLQAVSLPDTIVARTIPDRGVLEWTSGLLELLVLLLAVGALIGLILLLAAMREGVKKLNGTLDRLVDDTRPLLTDARAVVADARDMVATVKRDVSHMSGAAAAMGDTIRDAAEVTAQRIDEVNAVLDVVQAEIEETAITAASAVRSVRLGARALLAYLPRRRRRKRRRREDGAREDGAREDGERPDARPDDDASS